MKKIKWMIVVVILLFTTGSALSQTFNEIEVGLSEAQTKTLLLQKKFTFVKSFSKNMHEYSGKLASREIVKIYLLTTPKSKKCWKLVVNFSECYTWNGILRDYNKYKAILIKKYGIPTDDFAFFSSPYKKKGGYEMLTLYSGACTYASIWDTPDSNMIMLDIESFKYKEAFIRILYENKKCSDVYTKEIEELNTDTF